ncbi:MAG TPA: helix-turn-helix domain-containing protein [Thermoproteota archaeon]|nr:helix-turn-helix domain-containing protein [Thermoproteota archaeon]
MTLRHRDTERSLLTSQTFRVLRVLIDSDGFMSISSICRKANLNHPSAARALSLLEAKGVVSEKRVGRTRMFRANYADERISLFRKLAASGF